MTIQFTSKQPYEEYAISFDFGSVLGVETIASAVLTATDQADSSDVTATLLDSGKQSNSDKIVYGWVRAGTSGHDYTITCRIVGSADSHYELDGVLPVLEEPESGIPSGGGCVIAPTIEPITLAELKLHLRLDSGSFADNVDESQSIAPNIHTVTVDYDNIGASVEVLGYSAIAAVQSGTNEATGTVDVKIQESDDNVAFGDWSGGSFAQITTANDNTLYEKAYTGTKRYIRTVAKILNASCGFGTSIIRLTSAVYEDELLTEIIQAARECVEDITRRHLLTQTWDYKIQAWPSENYLTIPGGNLQSISSVKWKDEDGAETTLVSGTDYLVETNGTQCGRIVLPYGVSWPTDTLYPSNPITVRYVAGWESASALPSQIRTACKMICADLYEMRGEPVIGQTVVENKVVMRLLASNRLWEEFQ